MFCRFKAHFHSHLIEAFAFTPVPNKAQMGCEWIEDKMDRASEEEKDEQIQGEIHLVIACLLFFSATPRFFK